MHAAELPDLVIVGPSEHGVVQYGHELAEAMASEGQRHTVHSFSDIEAVWGTSLAARMHLHITDRILGSTPEDAADNVERLASMTSLSITIHDVPQPSDGSAYSRRVAAYSRFIDAASAVVVNSHHEAQLLAEHVDPSLERVAVIPLGARAATSTLADLTNEPRTNGNRPLMALVAGFIYPGKGHSVVIDALAAARGRLQADGEYPGPVVAVAIGGPSRGHEADVDALRDRARSVGVRFEVTGYLDEAAYRRATLAEGIPVAAHQHVSASRSMLDWLEQGRRPLVPRSRYATEMAALRPGTISLYDPSRLAESLVEAWRHIGSTRLPAGTDLGPTMRDTAAAYRSWWAGLDA